MEKKKGTQSWRISDELWEEIKEYMPKKQRYPNKHYQKEPVQGRQDYPPDRCWRVFSMFCEPDVSGKLFRENMDAAAVFTGTFKNGKRQVSLKRRRKTISP